MVKLMPSMVLALLPEHAEHPLQSFHLHLALHGFGRDLHHDSQTPLLLPFVVKAVRDMCVDGDKLSNVRDEISE